ncbi:class A beta-lactamase [Variovorax paradoxus]|nr:class A beta-lactamase [Variovorax paradoxus]MBT2300210.1 class A beta-lactamase [Variovorax paradoxus]
MIHRRQFTSTLFVSLAATSFGIQAEGASDLSKQLADIENASGGRLGVGVLDTGTGRRAGHREDERFPLCSTFKFLAAAFVLARVDQRKERLERRVVYGPRDLVTHSPVTEKHADGTGMTVAQLCEATLTLSDNTAANLLLHSFGGPKGLTAFMRSIGDPRTRLDRFETALNEARPGDLRDTTTPAAMSRSMQKILLGDILTQPSRAQLLQWLDGNKTGDERIRAGLPADWKVGDRTGSGQNGTTNDIAILRPPGRAPILLSVYLTETAAAPAARNATLASVATAVAGWA